MVTVHKPPVTEWLLQLVQRLTLLCRHNTIGRAARSETDVTEDVYLEWGAVMDDLHGQEAVTERRNPRSELIDRMSSHEIVELINREDQAVAAAVESALTDIASVIEAVAAAFRQGGRLVYVGAGTSGRIAVLDAAECPPTFSTPPEQVVALIAGGDRALRTAVEGAEDDPDAGAADIRSAEVTGADVVVGVSANGGTPYVEGAVREAGRCGARTALVTASDPEMCTVPADMVVALPVGPEVIAGSTRMKAGTATKMALNMISTGAMVLTGKVYRNMMVDLRPNSAKLKRRAVRIVCEVAGVDEQPASRFVDDANGCVKLAVVMAKTGLDKDAAQRLLDKERGFVYRVIEQADSKDQLRTVSGRSAKKMDHNGGICDRLDAGSVDSVAGVQSDTADPPDRGDCHAR